MGFGDIRDIEGAETEAEFVSEFGAEKVFYKNCDVTSDEQVKVSELVAMLWILLSSCLWVGHMVAWLYCEG